MLSILHKNDKRLTIALLVGASVLATITLSLIILISIFDGIFLKILIRHLSLLPGSTILNAWLSSTKGELTSFYIFNITNEKEVLSGDAPQLQEIGPFVYRRTQIFSDVTFSSEQPPKLLHYNRTTLYHFVPELSAPGSMESNIITPCLLHVKNILNGRWSWSSLLSNTKPFIRLTPHEVIWGYPFYGNEVGVMGSTNNSVSTFSVDTGAYEIAEVGRVRSWNGIKKMTSWEQEESNIIDGTSKNDKLFSLGEQVFSFNSEVYTMVNTYYYREV
ncbi:unnamed protein product [Dicrocoelium dendriticum]|nr:unnamed protein product [Dicrocoelium dendriticum]